MKELNFSPVQIADYIVYKHYSKIGYLNSFYLNFFVFSVCQSILMYYNLNLFNELPRFYYSYGLIYESIMNKFIHYNGDNSRIYFINDYSKKSSVNFNSNMNKSIYKFIDIYIEHNIYIEEENTLDLILSPYSVIDLCKIQKIVNGTHVPFLLIKKHSNILRSVIDEDLDDNSK